MTTGAGLPLDYIRLCSREGESPEMGQGLSCHERADGWFLDAVEDGNVDLVRAMAEEDPSHLERIGGNGRHHALHLAAANGRIQVGLCLSFCFFLIDFLMCCGFIGNFLLTVFIGGASFGD